VIYIAQQQVIGHQPMLRSKIIYQLMKSKALIGDHAFYNRQGLAVIEGAQGMKSAADISRKDAVQVRVNRAIRKITKHFHRQSRHVAGHNQVPIGLRRLEKGLQSADGSVTLGQVADHRPTEMRVTLRRSDDSDTAYSSEHGPGRQVQQVGAAQLNRQQGLISSHPSAVASGQDKTGNLASSTTDLGLAANLVVPDHLMIVASMSRSAKTRSNSNKMVYICFLVNFVCVLAMLTSPMHAADVAIGAVIGGERPASSSLLKTASLGRSYVPTPATHTFSVVRVDKTTGKLVRSIAPTTIAAKPVFAQPVKPPSNIDELVQKSARAHGVDPLLVHSVIQVESAYNAHAVSPKGAEGLMQLMPGTSAQLGVGNSFDPGQNIEAGVRYLKSLQTLYKDDRLALAAYNAGPAAVDKYKDVPPYAETVHYVEQVGARYRASHDQAENSRAALASGNKAEYQHGEQVGSSKDQIDKVFEKEMKHPKLEQYIDDQGRLYLKTAAE
jgi:hypothetical protein